MKARQAEIVWTKQIKVTVYAPEDMSAEDLRRLARHVSIDGLRDWDEPSWSTLVGVVRDVEYPVLSDAVVVSDTRDDFVCAEDATWWMP
jgi:hypothetical protein